MYRMYVSGKTVQELKANIENFLNMIGGAQMNTTSKPSQPMVDDSAQLSLPVAASPIPDNQQVAQGQAQELSAASVLAPTVSGQVDAKGLPWDERIHASSMAKTQDGTWRYKRGVEDSTKYQIEAELRQRGGVTQAPVPAVPNMGNASVGLNPTFPAATLSVPDVPTSPTGVLIPPNVAPSVETPIAPTPSPLALVPQPGAQPAPAVSQTAPPPIPQQVTLAHTFQTFKANLVATLAELVKQGKLNQQYIAQLCGHFKVNYIHEVTDEQLSQMFENFVAGGLLQKVTV